MKDFGTCGGLFWGTNPSGKLAIWMPYTEIPTGPGCLPACRHWCQSFPSSTQKPAWNINKEQRWSCYTITFVIIVNIVLDVIKIFDRWVSTTVPSTYQLIIKSKLFALKCTYVSTLWCVVWIYIIIIHKMYILYIIYIGNFPVGLAARKGLRRATFLRPKRVPKTKKKVASKNPKPKGKLLIYMLTYIIYYIIL